MREHLYKAKRLDNGEWAEGSLTHFVNSGNYKIAVPQPKENVETNLSDWMRDYTVIPETVCEFTGLLDKNGKKIFEDDVVKSGGVKKWSYRIAIGNCHPEGLSYQHGIFTSKIKTICGVHGVEITTGQECFFGLDPDENGNTQELEVIGSIHDKPEE